MSVALVRHLGACTLAAYLLSAGWFYQVARAQEPNTDTYAGLSPSAAQAKFERALVQVRRQQRETLHEARQELQSLSVAEQVDEGSRHSIKQLIERLSSSRDYLTSLELVLHTRGQLDDSVRADYDQVTKRLSDQWSAYQRCKQAYQLAVGRSLAERWPGLSLENKRCELSDYLALADQRPAWLVLGSPIDISQLIPPSAAQPINQYLAEKRELVRAAQDELQPKLNETLRLAREAADDRLADAEQRAAALHIATILEAPYTRGLRGVVLCQPTDELPEKLRLQIQAMLDEYLRKIHAITPDHKHLLRELNTRLESSQRDRLANLKLEEQMLIDLYLAQVTHLIEPIRILASRSARCENFESAKVLEFSKSGDLYRYRVQFLIDGVSQWLEASQTRTRQPTHSSSSLKAMPTARSDTPNAAPPGRMVTNLTNFDSGQVFAYCPAGWKPVVVVDESSMGVVIRWHGAVDAIETTRPRDQLRIVTNDP